MQTRPVTYKNAEAVHRNNEPEAPTILTEVNAKASWFQLGKSCPLFLLKQQDFCTCWGQKETNQVRGALLISAQHCSSLF